MVTFAVTLSDLIEKGGAYAGLAAFFGLAILAILYFAQAREIRRLREWAGRAPERAQELEQRVVEQAEVARRVQPVPSRRPGEPATAAAQRAAVPAVTPAPVVAAEAVTTAEPKVEGEDAEEVKPETDTEAAPAAAEAAEEAKPAEAEDSPAEHEVVASTATPEKEEDAEAVPAGAATAVVPAVTPAVPPANGASEAPPKLPPRVTQSPPVRRPAPVAQPLRASAPPSRRAPGAPPASDEPGGRRSGIIIAGVIAGVVLIVVGLIAIFSGGGSNTKKPATSTAQAPRATAAPSTSRHTSSKAPSTPSRADTKVAVLNGTTVAGLAGTVDTKITQAGYTESQKPTNYTDQARSASVVFYSGSENRTQAIAIKKLLDVSDVQPIIDAAAQLAPGADVVVVVGADQTP